MAEGKPLTRREYGPGADPQYRKGGYRNNRSGYRGGARGGYGNNHDNRQPNMKNTTYLTPNRNPFDLLDDDEVADDAGNPEKNAETISNSATGDGQRGYQAANGDANDKEQVKMNGNQAGGHDGGSRGKNRNGRGGKNNRGAANNATANGDNSMPNCTSESDFPPLSQNEQDKNGPNNPVKAAETKDNANQKGKQDQSSQGDAKEQRQPRKKTVANGNSAKAENAVNGTA
uniref:Uncharacterized protein n=1 Tax=Ciona savignyi TaxID=51511 RepID=H2Z4W7_CIOSA